jgi:hypothetical protein
MHPRKPLAATIGLALIALSLQPNAGLTSLSGGALDTNGKFFSNAGQITGYGVLATGGLSHSGAITFSGGTSTVIGSVTNAAAGTIEVANSRAVFSHPVVNNGLFKRNHASVTFAGGHTPSGLRRRMETPAHQIAASQLRLTARGAQP